MDFDPPHLGGDGANNAKPPKEGPVNAAPLAVHHHQQQQQQQQQQHPKPGGGAAAAAPSGSLGGLGIPQGQGHGQSQSHEQDNGSEHDGDHSGGEHEGDGDVKKARACEACRGLKVRCEPDPDNHDGPCKRCRKAKRACVVTAPTRKRQKRTDSRVAELEKKIDALTASLQARAPQAANSSNSNYHNHGHGQQQQQQQQRHSPVAGTASAPGSISHILAASPTTASAGTPPLRQRSSAPGDESSSAMSWNPGPPALRTMDAPAPAFAQQNSYGPARGRSTAHSPPPRTSSVGQKRKAADAAEPDNNERGASSPAPGFSLLAKPVEGDVVDRDIITMELADEVFSRYTQQMVHEVPAVVFPPDMTASELRRSKPVLFLSVMAAASGEHPQIQKALQREMTYVLAERIMLIGEKSLELVQALQVYLIWYWPPDHTEELKFYQFTHVAAVMAIDIGLGKKGPPLRSMAPFSWREHPGKRAAPPDPMTLESRRAWLACHFLCTNTSIAMHRPSLFRWTPFMSDCLKVLSTSPDAAPTDKTFCHLVWCHRHGEEVALQFEMDDASATTSITERRTQHILKGLQRNLDKYRASVPQDQMPPTLAIGFNIVTLFMYELAIHSDSTNDRWRPPFQAESLQDGIVQSDTLSTAHIDALSACLAASTSALDLFLSLPTARVRCLPVFNFVRVAFALVIRLKMWFTASNPRLDLGSVISREELRAEYYVEALVDKFCAAAVDEKCRQALKFLVVLGMLRTWFLRHRKPDGTAAQIDADTTPQRSASSSGDAAPSHQQQNHPQQQQQQQRSSKVNTPLHLLSEVATVGDSITARSAMFNKNSGIPQSSFSDLPVTADIPPASRFAQQQQNLSSMGSISSTGSGLDGPHGPSAFQPDSSSSSPWAQPHTSAAAEFGGPPDLSTTAGFYGMGLGFGLGLESADLTTSGLAMTFMSDAWGDFENLMGTMPEMSFLQYPTLADPKTGM